MLLTQPMLRFLARLLLLCTLCMGVAMPAAHAQGPLQGQGTSNSLDNALRALGGTGQGPAGQGSPVPGGVAPLGTQPFHPPSQFPQTQPPAAAPLNGALRRAVDHLRPLDPCLDPKGCPKQVVQQVQAVVDQLAGPTGEKINDQLSAAQAQVTATSTAVQAAVTAVQASAAASQAGAAGLAGTAVSNSQPLIDVAVQQLTASQSQLKTLITDLGSRLDVAAQLVSTLENEPPGTLPLSLKYLITGQVNDSIVFAKSQAQKLAQRLKEVEQAVAQAQQAAQAAAAAVGTAGQQQAQAEAARAAQLAAQLQQTLLEELKPVQQQLDQTAQTLQQALDQAGIPLDLPPTNPTNPGLPGVPSPEQPLPSAPGLTQPSNQPPAPGPAIPPSQRAVWDDHGRLQAYLAPGDTPATATVRNYYDAGGERRIKQVKGGIEVLYVTPDYSITIYPDDDAGRDLNNPDNNSNVLSAAGQSARVDTRTYNHHIRLDGQRITSLQRGLGYARPDCREPGNPNAIQPQHATWYATDHLGSTELQTDACGHLIARLAYFPWGQRWQEAHGTKDQGNDHFSPRHNVADPDTSYSGQQQDPESGLTQYSQRWYDPDLGVWLSTDPILDQYLQGGGNSRGVFNSVNLGLYTYARNNPAQLTDPSGNEAPCISLNAGCGVDLGVGEARIRGMADSALRIGRFMLLGPAPEISSDGNAQVVPPPTNPSQEQLAEYTNGQVIGAVIATPSAGMAGKASLARTQRSATWGVSAKVTNKIPSGWQAKPNKKGVGTRWEDPSNKGNGVRIDQGNSGHSLPSQQVDHVIVRRDGKVIGRDGKPIQGSIKENPEQAHIPLSEYEKWKKWDSPL